MPLMDGRGFDADWPRRLYVRMNTHSPCWRVLTVGPDQCRLGHHGAYSAPAKIERPLPNRSLQPCLWRPGSRARAPISHEAYALLADRFPEETFSQNLITRRCFGRRLLMGLLVTLVMVLIAVAMNFS
jgi:hypothetical protein